MAESMFERVALAIANAAYDDKAKAAIEAMREPTEGSIAAGVSFLIDANLDGPDGVADSDVRGCFQAIVDRVLEDG